MSNSGLTPQLIAFLERFENGALYNSLLGTANAYENKIFYWGGSGDSTWNFAFGDRITVLGGTAAASLEWLLFPAILANQYKLYLKKTRPVGFAAWAKVTPEVAARLDSGDSRLKPEEWRCGELVRLIHVIAPMAEESRIREDLSHYIYSTNAQVQPHAN